MSQEQKLLRPHDGSSSDSEDNDDDEYIEDIVEEFCLPVEKSRPENGQINGCNDEYMLQYILDKKLKVISGVFLLVFTLTWLGALLAPTFPSLLL